MSHPGVQRSPLKRHCRQAAADHAKPPHALPARATQAATPLRAAATLPSPALAPAAGISHRPAPCTQSRAIGITTHARARTETAHPWAECRATRRLLAQTTGKAPAPGPEPTGELRRVTAPPAGTRPPSRHLPPGGTRTVQTAKGRRTTPLARTSLAEPVNSAGAGSAPLLQAIPHRSSLAGELLTIDLSILIGVQDIEKAVQSGTRSIASRTGPGGPSRISLPHAFARANLLSVSSRTTWGWLGPSQAAQEQAEQRNGDQPSSSVISHVFDSLFNRALFNATGSQTQAAGVYCRNAGGGAAQASYSSRKSVRGCRQVRTSSCSMGSGSGRGPGGGTGRRSRASGR